MDPSCTSPIVRIKVQNLHFPDFQSDAIAANSQEAPLNYVQTRMEQFVFPEFQNNSLSILWESTLFLYNPNTESNFFLLFFNYLLLSCYVQLRFISKQRKSICQSSVLMYIVREKKEGQNTTKAKAEKLDIFSFYQK